MKKVTIHIVSGFLGSGKTSFLRKILLGQEANKKSLKLALIENEFGKIALDATIIRNEASDLQLYELASGCLCCTLQDDFSKTLLQLLEQGPFDFIFVEPSGVALSSNLIRQINELILVQKNLKKAENKPAPADVAKADVAKADVVKDKQLPFAFFKNKIRNIFMKKAKLASLPAIKLGEVIHNIDLAPLFLT